jgi:hypothetical protein
MAFLILSMPILLLAVYCVRVGLRGRRVGDSPHCPKCDYIVYGRIGGTCTECGETLEQQTIRYGDRRRYPLLVLFGSLWIAGWVWVTLITTLDGLRVFDIYEHLPTTWVASHVDLTNQRATDEIKSRRAAGTIKSGDWPALIDAGLRVQAAHSESGWSYSGELIFDYWLDLLGGAEAAGLMCSEQLQRFYRQGVGFDFEMQKEYWSEGKFAYRWQLSNHLNRSHRVFVVKNTGLRMGDHRVELDTDEWSMDTVATSGAYGATAVMDAPGLPIGSWRAEFPVTIEIYRMDETIGHGHSEAIDAVQDMSPIAQSQQTFQFDVTVHTGDDPPQRIFKFKDSVWSLSDSESNTDPHPAPGGDPD